MRNFINKNNPLYHREKQRGSMVIVNNIFMRRISSTLILLLFLTLLLLPVSFASTARDPTLRSRLYEQFRCGNGICEVVETALICPEDCPGEPEPANETSPQPTNDYPPPTTSGGFERISTIVSDEYLFDEPAEPAPVFSSSSSSAASSTPLIILILLILALVGIVVYALRNTTPFQHLFGRIPTTDDDQLPLTHYPQPATHNPLPTPQPSTILAGLISKFTNKGLTPGEMYTRITRMGLWDDDTIRRQLKIKIV